MKKLFLLLSFNFLLAGEIKTITENEILKNFDPDTKIEIVKYSLNGIYITEIEKQAQQRFNADFVYIWKVIENDSLVAVALLDNVTGKSMPITFLTIFSTGGEIIYTRVIKYRESIGGEIENVQWLEQFIGKNITNEFKVGREIDAISGATISVNAITRGIKKLTLLFPFIQKEIN